MAWLQLGQGIPSQVQPATVRVQCIVLPLRTSHRVKNTISMSPLQLRGGEMKEQLREKTVSRKLWGSPGPSDGQRPGLKVLERRTDVR